MPSPRADQLASVKRMLLRLRLLDGRLVVTREGPRLVPLRSIKDPGGLVDAASEPGGLSSAALARHLELVGSVVDPTERWLGAAQRDLRILRQSPGLLRFIAQSQRALRRHGVIDEAWLAERQSRLDTVGAAVAAAKTEQLQVGPSPDFTLVASLRGPLAARHLSRWYARSVGHGRRLREAVRLRLLCLEANLQGAHRRCDVPDEVLAEAVTELERVRHRPGRVIERTVRRVVRSLLAWPEPPSHVTDTEVPLPRDLLEAVHEAGALAIAALPSSRDPRSASRLAKALTLLGLTCETEEDGALSPSDSSLVLRAFGTHRGPGEPAPTMGNFLALLRLELDAPLVPIATGLIAQGLKVATIARLAQHRQLSGLSELHEDLPAVQAWTQWTLEVAVPLAAQGVEVTLPPRLFSSEGPHPELRAFARVLLANRAKTTPAATLEALDSMMALLKAEPEHLTSLRAELLGTSPGLGKEVLPAFAAWLGDDEALDRYCHLKRLAGEPTTLSRALGRDFHEFEKLTHERAHLLALPRKSEAQRTRLERLEARLQASELPDAQWTRRRLAERNEELVGRALERRLDAALRGVLKRLWGIKLAPAPLTPAWRDAVRFLLTTTKNQELLGVLLGHAANHPGEAIVTTLPLNRRWLEEARGHLDVDAWLRPRSVPVELSGRGYTLSTEVDPLEALRMGIPFGTCLSLTDGVNAAAAVLNAMDANKRVLYLRAPDGSIVARKLLAVSREWRLLGYRLYLALDDEHEAVVGAAFEGLCLALAREAGLPLGSSGEPARIHPGFWYDDGTTPFGGTGDELTTRYCAWLGQPPAHGDAVLQEARVWDARARNDVDAALAAVDRWSFGGSSRALALWALERLGEAEALRRAPEHHGLAEALLERAFGRGPEHLLAMYQRLGRSDWHRWRTVSGLLERLVPSERLARQLVDVSRALRGTSERFDDHDIEHGTMYLLPGLLESVSVATAFELLERIEPVWRYVVEQEPTCSSCLDVALSRSEQACLEAYARSPEPQAVLTALLEARSPVTTGVALAIAARFSFPRGRRETPPRLSRLATPPAPTGCPAALRALRGLRARRRELADDPRLLAAMLRQSGPLAPVTLEELPQPASPPFEELGDLQVLLPELTHAIFSRYDEVPTEAPGPWALSYHRRHSTRWRRMLQRAAHGDDSALTWLALLGEAEVVAAALRRPRQRRERARVVPGPKARAVPVHELGPLARCVAREVAGEDDPFDAQVVDRARVSRRLAALDEATGANDSAAAIAICRSLEGAATPTLADWRAITEELLEREAPDEVLAEVCARWIPRTGYGAAELPVNLVVRLMQLPLCRRELVAALARLDPDKMTGWYHRLLAAAPAERAIEPLLEEWLGRWLPNAQGDLGGEELYAVDGLRERIIRLAWGDVRTAVQVFQWIPEAAEAVRMMPELVERFGPSAVRAAINPKAGENGDVADRHRWLVAALEAPLIELLATTN